MERCAVVVAIADALRRHTGGGRRLGGTYQDALTRGASAMRRSGDPRAPPNVHVARLALLFAFAFAADTVDAEPRTARLLGRAGRAVLERRGARAGVAPAGQRRP